MSRLEQASGLREGDEVVQVTSDDIPSVSTQHFVEREDEELGWVGVQRGDVIGGTYRVERLLGVGGMGVVVLAFDNGLHRWVAIKFVRSELFASADVHDLFLAEARGMARVSHPNVLAVYAFGHHKKTPYFVMEYVDGRTAAEWLLGRPKGTLPSSDEVIRLLEQACLGVEAIHASHIVHRDIKPSNILLDDDFRVAVGDFGLSCLAGPRSPNEVAVGTAAYMAPETVLGEHSPFEFARDVYALGCIAYEMLAGQPPHVSDDTMSVQFRHAFDTPKPPSEHRPELGRLYDDVVLMALAKSSSDRYRSVGAFRKALMAAHHGTTDPTRILVADDDADWRELLTSSLRRSFPNAVLDSAPDGLSALHAFCDAPYSVVLLDLDMPELSGMDVTFALRALESARRTAIVILTASGGPSEWRRLSHVGADAFLVKPANLADIEVVVRRTYRARREAMPSA